MIKVFCDGGSRGNPGPSASAFVVYKDEVLLHEDSKYLGVTTNNVAEYSAVLMALEYLQTLPANEEIVFVLDSQLVKEQLSGNYKVKNETLKNLYQKVDKIKKNIKTKITFTWSYRTSNKTADALVNKELDLHS